MNKNQKIVWTIFIVIFFIIWIKGRIGCTDLTAYKGNCSLDAIVFFIIDALIFGIPAFILSFVWKSKK